MNKRFFLYVFILLLHSCGWSQNENLISPKSFKEAVETNNNELLLDVRTPEEFASGHIESAINIDWNGSDFELKINQLNHSKPIFIYCLGGVRSKQAAEFLKKKGFKTVFELEGGIKAWKSSQFPIVQ